MAFDLRGFSCRLILASSMLLGSFRIGHAKGGGVPSQVWAGSYSKKQERARMKRYDLPQLKINNGKTILNANPETRLETELQTTVKLADLGKMRTMMDELANDPAKAEALLGKGYTIVQLNKAPRTMADPYLDTADGEIAKSGGSLRVRIENGVAKVNFKPPTAERFANGVAHRIEAGIAVQLDASGNLTEKSLDFLTNSKLKDNPLREWKQLYPKINLRKMLSAGPTTKRALDITQQRAIYEVQLDGMRINELSVDHVTAMDPATGKTFEFGSFEGEGDHLALVPTATQLAKMQASQQTGWTGPHTAADTRNAAMVGTRSASNPGQLGSDASPDVKQVHMVAEAFLAHFAKAGLDVSPAGQNKYVRGRLGLGIGVASK